MKAVQDPRTPPCLERPEGLLGARRIQSLSPVSVRVSRVRTYSGTPAEDCAISSTGRLPSVVRGSTRFNYHAVFSLPPDRPRSGPDALQPPTRNAWPLTRAGFVRRHLPRGDRILITFELLEVGCCRFSGGNSAPHTERFGYRVARAPRLARPQTGRAPSVVPRQPISLDAPAQTRKSRGTQSGPLTAASFRT
jgi:hypothetical protein